MSEPKPPLHADLTWDGDLRFAATSGTTALIADGDGTAGPSPMHLMALGVLSCMAADIVAILRKGRHPLQALHSSFSGTRLPEPPRRFTSITLHFALTGQLADDVVARAIELSRTRYCSAWNSMRDDITLTTTYTIVRE
jgi:putative redox protein